MKKKTKFSNLKVAMIAVGIAAIGTVAFASSYALKGNTVIENQVVNGNNVYQAAGASPDLSGGETLGASRATGNPSTLTNFARKGVQIECDNPTSTRCTASVTEVVRYPKGVTSTMVLQNPIGIISVSSTASAQATSTVSLQFFPRVNGAMASSTYQLTCVVTSTNFIGFTMNLEGITPTSSPRIFTKYTITTGTLPMIDSMQVASTTRQPFLGANAVTRSQPEGRVEVGPTQNAVCILQQETFGICGTGTGAGACEQVTTTNSGLDYDVAATWKWIVTSTDILEF